MHQWITVADTKALAPGQRQLVAVDDTEIAVFNLDGQYYAIENICSHDGGKLTGAVVEGDQIICPRHGARFCIRTGAALSAPAYEPTHLFPVRIHADAVQVRDNRWDD